MVFFPFYPSLDSWPEKGQDLKAWFGSCGLLGKFCLSLPIVQASLPSLSQPVSVSHVCLVLYTGTKKAEQFGDSQQAVFSEGKTLLDSKCHSEFFRCQGRTHRKSLFMSETNLYYVIENVLSYSNLLLLKSLMCFYFFQAVDKKVSYKY